jgi:hypothetical protein
MGKGEPGQSIRPGGKVAGRSPLHAGSHGKVRRLKRRAAGLSIDARRRSDPRAAPTLRSRAAGSSEKGKSGRGKNVGIVTGASAQDSSRSILSRACFRSFEITLDQATASISTCGANCSMRWRGLPRADASYRCNHISQKCHPTAIRHTAI